MNKSIEMFFTKLNEDESFAAKIGNTKEVALVLELAKEQGIELTMDDLKEIKSIFLQVKEAKAKTSELSEEELENVAGGATPAVSATVASAAATIDTSINHCETIISAVSSWSWPW